MLSNEFREPLLSFELIYFRNSFCYCCRKTAVCNGDNRSIFLYQNLFGANQRFALSRKSFRIAQVSHCAVQLGLAIGDCANVAVLGFTPCMLCVKSAQSALSDLKRPPERLQSQCNYRLFIT